MASKLIMTTVSASCFLIVAFLLHLPAAAAATDNHLSSGQCEPHNLHGCKFYLSSFRKKVVAAGRTEFYFNPFYDQLEKQKLSACCDELQGMDRECRCLAINEIARQHIQNQCDHDQQMDVVRSAINLAERCHLQPRFCLVFFTGPRSIC